MAAAKTAQPKSTQNLLAGQLADFSGGPNLRDSASELAANELEDAWNITLDERGGAASRLGYVKRNSSALGSTGDLVVNDTWVRLLGKWLTQAGDSLYLDDGAVSVHTFSTADCVTFAETDDKVVAAHPVDGMFASADGSAWTKLGQLGTVTITIASPAVFTCANHGLSEDDEITLSTTGSLPSGLTAGTTYYVLAAGLTSSEFEVAATAGGVAINTSGSQSGTHTLSSANVPAEPLCVTAWEAKLWVGLADGSVHWSKAAQPQLWLADDFNEIWTIDQQPIVNLHVGSGQDIQGRPGLLVFKNDSVYRINDPATGAYTVIDATNGCGGPKAVVGVGAKVIWIGKHGVFWWDESLAQPTSAADLLQPLWKPDQVNIGQQALWCAGRRLNRAYFSLCRFGSSANDTAFEFHPDQGWIVPRSDAMSCYATSSDADEVTSGGSPSVDGQCYQLDTGGDDDGAEIDWRIQTRWIVVNAGFDGYVWLARLHGRGEGTCTVRTDYQETGGTETPFDLVAAGATYDSGLHYDSGVDYASMVYQATQPVYSVGRCRQFSVRLSGSSSTTVSAPQVFGAGDAPQVGAFALYGLEFLYVALGLS